ncbi:uncharacterized protein LOC100908825, partial [Galendromus occidentalis]|uniref:Uncharacterized protein LOC100908825 n=1 Tax=Galendromus occidentalis TaxID=34638 RepID=A0AAJ6VWG6_9ACAR
KACTFYNENSDKRDSLDQVDDYRETLNGLLTEWLSASRTQVRQPQRPNSQSYFENFILIEEQIRCSLRYLRNLGQYLVNCLSPHTVDSSFDQSTRGSDPTREPPRAPLSAPQWRASTQIEEQARAPAESGEFTSMSTPFVSHIAQLPPPAEESPSLPQALQPSNASGAQQPLRAPEAQRPPEHPMTTATQSGSSQAENPDNYLPKLSKNFKLPKFNGDPKQFRKFMDMFNAFVHERQIPTLQKILLLHDALTGRAYHSVRHFSLNAESYEPMKQMLQELFGQTNMAEDSHLRELERILSSKGEISYDKLPNFVNSISNTYWHSSLSGNHTCQAPLTFEERQERMLAARACFKCLKLNHDAKHCREGPKTECRYCNASHYAIICPKAFKNQNGKPPRSVSTNINLDTLGNSIFLWTALAWAEAGNTRIPCRILIDPGSQATHITRNLVEKLKSKPVAHTDLTMATAGGQVTNIYNCGIHEITLRSRHQENLAVRLRAIELDCVSRSEFPVMEHAPELTPAADSLPEHGDGLVDDLLGQDHFTKINFADPQSFDDTFAFNSIFGYVFGGSQRASTFKSPLTRFCGFDTIQPASILPTNQNEQLVIPESDPPKDKPNEKAAQTMKDLQFLWQSEDVGFEDDLRDESQEEEDSLNKALIDHFRKTTFRDENGRYVLKLPFKSNIRSLGDNQNLARSRLHSFLEKLKKDPIKLKAVDEEIKGYLEAGFAEKAQPKKAGQLSHYLPIQAVFKAKPDSPLGTKTRVVKDASARRTNEAGLNDVLHCGINLLPEITKVLLKFRQYKYAFTADIEKAFLQFRIADSDKNFLRFLWPLGINDNSSARIQEFYTARLDFGLICSPFLHCQGIRFHLESAMRDNPNDAPFLEEIMNHFYMDDIISGGSTIKEVKHRIKLLSDIFTEGHFPLKKWSTNSLEIGSLIKKISPIKDPEITTGQTNAKVLGITWNQVQDYITAPTSEALKELSEGSPSKRKLLRALAQIFDPLGIITPITINSKTLFQDLWKLKLGWDDPLQGNPLERFTAFRELVGQAELLNIPRQMLSPDTHSKRKLFIFSDASLHAHGMVAYLRGENADQKPKISFVLSKAKVAPVKPSTIHRLELLGALLAARMTKKIIDWVDFRIDGVELFCDNSAVLGWVSSNPDKWKPYVANRIRKIRHLVGDTEWHYVRSEENPADILSRGADISKRSIADLWFNGPQWLRLANSELERKMEFDRAARPRRNNESRDEIRHEMKNGIVSLLNASSENPKQRIFFEGSFSCWLKAIRFWAFMLRLKEKASAARLRIQTNSRCTARAKGKLNTIDAAEMTSARLSLIKLIQQESFPEGVSSDNTRVRPKSLLYQYNPFKDDDGILRCRSRLEFAPDLSQEQKFPIILPADCNLSRLIIRYIHEKKCLHFGGISNLLHILREEFLIIHARKLARQVISSCATCKIFHGQAASLPMAPLPAFRLETAPPFHHTGCDFAGPIKYKNDSGKRAKSYILLFVCAVTRAIHLELTTDMSTSEVLGALQKFVNRYPSVTTITSDNGLSFQRTAKELKLLYEHIIDGEIKKWLADKFIRWNFITPNAPSHGGFYERLVQSVKRPLRKVLGTSVPHFRDLEVILSNIELMINKRPITTVASGLDSTEALSPMDLLHG